MDVYEATMKEITKLEPELDYLLTWHMKSLVSSAVLLKVVEAFEKIKRGETEYKKSELYGYNIRIHEFEGFSILSQDN